jgi:hypothetical protein
MICEKLRNLPARFKSKPVHGFDWTWSQNLRKYRKWIQWLCLSGCWLNVQRSVPRANLQIDNAEEIKTESWVQWLHRLNMTLSMDKFVYLTVRRHGKSARFFSFSVHYNQPCDLSCANIIEMIAESDPISIPDISIYIFSVILDYELMSPVLIRWEYISDMRSRSFKLSISDRHSERLDCQYLENGNEIASEKLTTCMK